jgi:nitrite reductase (NADH) small subunit
MHMVSGEIAMIPVCPVEDIPLGLGRSFEMEGKKIAIFRSRVGSIFAVDADCPHKKGPLADGMLAGEKVVCPLHAFRFDAKTGQCDQEGISPLQTYPIIVREGEIFLQVDALQQSTVTPGCHCS